MTALFGGYLAAAFSIILMGSFRRLLISSFLLMPLGAAAQSGSKSAQGSDSVANGQTGREMDEVTVYGRTAVQEANRQSYNITAIDATKLHNTTLDISHVLDRVSGIRVREDGGVGSNINFSLNGFTGRQVRFFLDGVPMENFGSSFQINNIPVNLAERIEVYKGVVPIWLGADALGGAVNIVTSMKPQSYLDASYSFGSFNTHRTTLNAGYTSKSGFTAQLNLFQNYSDNNYWVHVDVSDVATGAYYRNQRIRRFHDNYHNETAIANIGFVGKKWADQLLVGFTAGQNYKEIQTGARLVSVFGHMHTKGNTLMPHIKYLKKDLFVKGLDLRLTGNYNFGSELAVDTVFRRYNWFQQYQQYTGAGAERARRVYDYRNNDALVTANLTYTPNEHHSFMVNDILTGFDREGADQLEPGATRYRQPQRMTKNVLGFGYKYDYNSRWSTSVFAKQYLLRTVSGERYNPSGNWGDVAYRDKAKAFHATGYGIASSYFLTDRTQLKASYERSYRLPDAVEVYGDVVNLDGNPELRPEQSHNINTGISTTIPLDRDNRLYLGGNVIYRDVNDFVRPSLNINKTMQIMENRDRVTNLSFDCDLRYSYKSRVTAGVTATYQNLRNKTRYEPGYTGESPLYGDRIPNMPFFFGNADATVNFQNVFGKGNRLSVGYNMLYVYGYYLAWPSMGAGSTKLDIPEQISHDLSLVYTLKDGRYNVAVECRNVLDARLYDNFSLQKPGRAFNVKLRCFISRKMSDE